MSANNYIGRPATSDYLPKIMWVCPSCEAVTFDWSTMDKVFCLGDKDSPHPRVGCEKYLPKNAPLFKTSAEYLASEMASRDDE